VGAFVEVADDVVAVVAVAVYEKYYFAPYSMHFLVVFVLEDRSFPD
jgi:hypothetical protein